MGFYIRKSVSVGLLRFNLSKSGVGVSAGLRGFRIGSGPRGNYIHIGRGGLYYRQTIAPRDPKSPGRPADLQSNSQRVPDGTHGPMHEIRSGAIAQMTDSSSVDLVAELNNKRKRLSLLPFIIGGAACCVILLASLSAPLWLLILVLLLFLLPGIGIAYYWDLMKKSVVMLYDMEDEAIVVYRQLHESLESLARSDGLWNIGATGHVYDPKYHAGANHLVHRKAIHVRDKSPPFVQANVPIYCVPVGSVSLYFFPDVLLVYASDGIGALSYDHLRIEHSASRFIEEEMVPRDAKIVDKTWRFVNKGGGPDRRFNNNRELPVCEYEEIGFCSNTGLRVIVQASRCHVGAGIKVAVKQIATSLAAARNASVLQPTKSNDDLFKASQQADDPAMAILEASSPTSDIVEATTSETYYEVVFRILCCVMVVDGRASSAEKKRVEELMREAGMEFEGDELRRRIADFIMEIEQQGFKKTLDQALSSLPLLASVGERERVITWANELSLADGEVSGAEQKLLQKIKAYVSRES